MGTGNLVLPLWLLPLSAHPHLFPFFTQQLPLCPGLKIIEIRNSCSLAWHQFQTMWKFQTIYLSQIPTSHPVNSLWNCIALHGHGMRGRSFWFGKMLCGWSLLIPICKPHLLLDKEELCDSLGRKNTPVLLKSVNSETPKPRKKLQINLHHGPWESGLHFSSTENK